MITLDINMPLGVSVYMHSDVVLGRGVVSEALRGAYSDGDILLSLWAEMTEIHPRFLIFDLLFSS
eukprot:COSAG01_NODE_6000_length_3908_cov_4.117616_3_plen_65_part_00